MHDVARAALPVAIGLLTSPPPRGRPVARVDDAQAQRLARAVPRAAEHLVPRRAGDPHARARRGRRGGRRSVVVPLALGAAAVLPPRRRSRARRWRPRTRRHGATARDRRPAPAPAAAPRRAHLRAPPHACDARTAAPDPGGSARRRPRGGRRALGRPRRRRSSTRVGTLEPRVSFASPAFLVGLALIPVLVVLYVRAERRPQAFAPAALLPSVVPQRAGLATPRGRSPATASRWRRCSSRSPSRRRPSPSRPSRRA